MRRWIFPVVFLALAVGAGVVAATAPTPVTTGPSPATTSTPLLSARRIPTLLAGAVADTRLRRDLGQVMQASDLGGARRASCLRVEDGDRILFDERSSLRLAPASNLKLLTGAAALALFGENAKLRTSVLGAKPTNGIVNGPLYLVGGGDPLLETADYAAKFKNQPQVYSPFEKLADAVVAAGVKQVQGGIIGDDSRFDSQRYVPSWRPVYISDHEIGPISALAVNDGFATFRPSLAPAPSPAGAAADQLKVLLLQRGVQVMGDPGAGPAAAGAFEIAGLDSLAMKDMVGQMLRESDNYTAEVLLKEIGKRASGVGSTAAGVAAAHKILADRHLPVADVAAVDGSGLDRSDRTSCATLLAVLDREGQRGSLVAGLAVAGSTGTLTRRFLGTPVEGRLRAKTGSLEAVTALTGFMARPGGALAFSLIANDLPDRTKRGIQLQESVAGVLARYPDSPAPAELGPQR